MSQHCTRTIGKQSFHSLFRVKSTAISLIVTVIIGMYYFANVMPLLPSRDTLPDGAISLIFITVILSVVVQSSLQIVLFIGAGQIEDRTEQDKNVTTKSKRNAHFVLSTGIVLTIMSSITFGFTMFQMINSLLLAFLVAEVIKYASQLIYYRHNL